MPTPRTINESGRAKAKPRFAARTRIGCAALVLLSAGLIMGAGRSKKRDRDNATSEKAAPQATTNGALPTGFSKSMAVQSVIGALGMSRNDAAQKTLEQIVRGEIDFGAHSREAVQYALLQFVLQPKPQSDAFLVRLIAEPDEKIRPGDKGAYPATALRADLTQVLTKAARPKLRLALAKLYVEPDSPAWARGAIEEIVGTANPANLDAQLELLQSSETPQSVKASIENALLERNASAVKQALKIEPTPEPAASPAGPAAGPGGSAPPGAGGSSMFSGLGKMMGFSGSAPNGPPAVTNASPPGGSTASIPPGLSAPNPAELPSSANAAASPPRRSLDRSRLKANMAAAMKGMPQGSNPAAINPPVAPLAKGPPAAQTPAAMILEMVAQNLSLQPIDAATVARAVWKTEFVAGLAKRLADAKAKKSELVGALASIPQRSARSSLKEYLQSQWANGPKDFAKLEAGESTVVSAGSALIRGKSALPSAATPPIRMGRGGRSRRGNEDALSAGQPATPMTARQANALGNPPSHQHVTEFGADWLDPGALLVLKTAGQYTERPKEKPKRPGYSSMYNTMGYGRAGGAASMQNPAVMRRAQQKAEKQKLAEAGYEWREAVEKLVRQWDERLNAAAGESPTSAAADDAAADTAGAEKTADGKSAKPGSKSSSKAADTPTIKASPAAPVPKPAVAMPFALHAGGLITKEFHVRWPDDLPGRLSSAVSDPLVVHYVRLEAPGEFGKTLGHYRTAITGASSAKTSSMVREIEEGKWLDAVQKDPAAHRSRSVDVLITRQSADDDDKKSKLEPLTVEILFVEIESFEAENEKGKGAGPTKKETASATSTPRSKRSAEN